MSDTDNPFGDNVIFSYSRAQAIEDGVLVDLMQPDTVKAVKEAGFKYPVACTARVFFECIALTPAAEAAGCDLQGRLWDVLYMLSRKAKRTPGDCLLFKLNVVQDQETPSVVELKCVIGPGDTMDPVITIMFPEED